MKLYHGTSAKLLPQILKHGVQPRGVRSGNWNKYPGRSDSVYLTIAYPFFFAVNHPLGGDALVLEISSQHLEGSLMRPDEDFIVQRLVGDRTNRIAKIHGRIRDRLEKYSHLWFESLNGLGNCAYRGTVPLHAISRYCIFCPEQRTYLTSLCLDPVVCIPNFATFAPRQMKQIQWFFGDRKTLPKPTLPHRVKCLESPGVDVESYRKFEDQVQAMADYQWRAWRSESHNRKGISVVKMERCSGNRAHPLHVG